MATGSETSTWESVAVPLLGATAQLEDQRRTVNSERLAAETGLDMETIGNELKRLYDADYIHGTWTRGGGESFDTFLSVSLRERGLRVTGVWPAEDDDEALVQMLSQRLEATEDPEDRGLLERLRAAATGGGRDVLVGLFTAWAQHKAGM